MNLKKGMCFHYRHKYRFLPKGIKPAMPSGQIDNSIEPIPFTPGNFVENNALLWEIKKDGIPIDNIGI